MRFASKSFLLVSLMCVAIASVRGQQLYQPVQFNSVGSSPADVIIVDWNVDGFADMASADFIAGTVTILLNDGTGSFNAGPILTTAAGPIAIDAADFNGDGAADLVVACQVANELNIFTNNGTGGSSVAATVAVGISPTDVVAGDLNGDGSIDVGSVNNGSADLSAVLNDGTGTLVLLGNLPVPAVPTALALGDIDQDGDNDAVVTTGLLHAVVILEATPAGFVVSSNEATGLVPFDVKLGDVDADGHLDIITSNSGDATISVIRGNGDMSFLPQTGFSTGEAPVAITLTNTDNRDGLDIVTAAFNSGTVAIHLNQGDGSYVLERQIVTGINPSGVDSGDLDGDLHDDIAIAATGSNVVSYLINATTDTPYPGTGGDLVSGMGINTPSITGPDTYVLRATPGDIVNVAASSPGGSFVGAPVGLGAQYFLPATPPSSVLSGIYLNSVGSMALVIVTFQSLPAAGFNFSAPLPNVAQLSGLSMMVQWFAFGGGTVEFADGHEIRID